MKTTNPYTEQIMRLSALRKFPLYPQGVKELRETLKRHASTIERFTAVIDRVIATSAENCPTPKQLAAIAGELRRATDTLPQGCMRCHGDPFVLLGAAMDRCTCPRGQRLRDRDRERLAVTA